MPNSRHSPAIFSPSSSRAMNFSRSSIGLHSFQGILLSLQKAPLCNPCARNELSPLSQEGQPLSSVGRASLSESEGPRFEAASGYQLGIKLSREARAVMGRSAKPEKTGSTPVRASNWLQWLEWTGARFLLGSMRVRILLGAPNACVAQRMSARVLDFDPIRLNRIKV